MKFTVAGRRQGAVAVVLAAVVAVAGCAGVPGGASLVRDSAPEAKAAAATKRSLERWDALLKGDAKTAYGYLSPASREVTSLERFQARTKGNFRSVRHEATTCEAETCRVKLWLTFDHKVMQGVTTPIEEIWVISDGQAWLVYRE